MHGILILFEGLPPTVIDSQVLTHVRLIRERLGIDLAVIAFACTPSAFEQAQGRLEQARQIAGGPVHLFRGIRPGLPGSIPLNRMRLASVLSGMATPSFFHVRGDYASAVAGPLARSMGISMLWDCRGDTHAEIEERRQLLPVWGRLLLSIRAKAAQRESRAAARDCAAACFVSGPLRDVMAANLDGKPTWILPCLANEDEFFFDPALRNVMRDKLGIAADETVFIYSGGLAGYQRFDEVVKSFARLLRNKPRARLIVLTPALSEARSMLAGLPADRVISANVSHGDVNGYLNAADFGLLLRDSTPVNRAAFPTKFAEYALAGLQVVMKQDPPGCVTEARELGILVPLDAVDLASPDGTNRVNHALTARSRMGRIANIRLFSDIYHVLSRQSELSSP